VTPRFGGGSPEELPQSATEPLSQPAAPGGHHIEDNIHDREEGIMNVAQNRIETTRIDRPAEWHHETTNIAHDQTPSRRRRIAGNVLIGLVSAALLGASATKFAHVAPVVAQLNGFGFNGPWVTLLGVIELASVVALIVPRTRALGLLLVTGFFGGAIATHIQHQELPTSPALLLALCWLGVWLRHPSAFWSLAGRNAAPSQ
jgi:hypothetical protein